MKREMIEENEMEAVVQSEQSSAGGRPDDARLLFEPNISINGFIDVNTLAFFLGRLEQVRSSNQDMILEINTNGGDADAARRIALEIQLFIAHSGRGAFCVGKTQVYSAGVTIFAAFPKQARFLTRDAVLLVHERRLDSVLEQKGPLKACLQIVREQLRLLETAEVLEKESFLALIEGSSVSLEEIYDRATTNCYIHAEEALRLGMIAEILS